MSKEEFAKVLEGVINDAEAAERVANGDFADLNPDDLTSAEQALLTAAASELDTDVAGFRLGYVKIGDIPLAPSPAEKLSAFRGANFSSALSYLKLGDIEGE